MRSTGPDRRDRGRFGGFTLYELLIALVVAGIIISMGAPAFIGMLDRHRLRAPVEQLYADLKYAQGEAIKRNRHVRIDFQVAAGGSTNWCWGLKLGSTACDCTQTVSTAPDFCEVDGQEKVVSSGDYSEVTLFSNTANPSLEFTGTRGMTGAAGDTFSFISPEGKQVDLVFSGNLGRIRVCSPSGTTNVGGYPEC